MSNVTNNNRKLICKNLEDGRSNMSTLAVSFGVSVSTVKRIWDRFLETGETTAIPKGGNRRKVLNQQHILFIKEHVRSNCLRVINGERNNFN